MAERFRLSKYYLDCATAGGEALIGYWAELRWRQLAVRYASALLFAGGRVEERSTLSAGGPPRVSPGRVAWRCDGLELDGAWTSSAAPPLARVLHRQGDGQVEWRCFQPLAAAAVACGGRRLEGTGYTELVTLTLAPWELPIDELRWGRAHLGRRWVVWVDWTGSPPRRLVLADGAEVEASEVSDARVAMPGATLTLGERRVLREGPVVTSPVGAVPGVRQLLAQAGLLIDEHKWLSSAMLEEAGRSCSGSAIHEVVRWR